MIADWVLSNGHWPTRGHDWNAVSVGNLGVLARRDVSFDNDNKWASRTTLYKTQLFLMSKWYARLERNVGGNVGLMRKLRKHPTGFWHETGMKAWCWGWSIGFIRSLFFGSTTHFTAQLPQSFLREQSNQTKQVPVFLGSLRRAFFLLT